MKRSDRRSKAATFVCSIWLPKPQWETFWHYQLGRKSFFHVNNAALLNLVSKQSWTGKLAWWMLLLREFEFKIQHRPIAVEDIVSRIKNGEECVVAEDDFSDNGILRILGSNAEEGKNSPNKWLKEMTYFLSTGLPPPHMHANEIMRLEVQSHNFCLLEGILYPKGSNGICWRCVREDEKNVVVQDGHCGIARGHYVGETTTRKIWQGGLWWPMTQKDTWVAHAVQPLSIVVFNCAENFSLLVYSTMPTFSVIAWERFCASCVVFLRFIISCLYAVAASSYCFFISAQILVSFRCRSSNWPISLFRQTSTWCVTSFFPFELFVIPCLLFVQ